MYTRAFKEMNSGLLDCETAYDKLEFICEYYKDYYAKGKARGGCPVVNVGVDSRNNNPKLFAAVQKLSRKLVENLSKLITEAQKDGVVRKDVNANTTAQNIYSMIQGGIFMAQTHNDESYLRNIVEQAHDLIRSMKN